MKRRELREHIFKLVFSSLEEDVFPEENFEYYFSDNEITESNAEYIKSAVNGISTNLSVIDKAILDNIKGYTFDRISKVCLAVMRVAVYEIYYLPDVPGNVSISEAIEIAEKYENEKSKSFVNGILGTILREKDMKKEENWGAAWIF